MYTLKVNSQKLNIRNTPAVDTTFVNWVGDLSPGELHTAQEIVVDANGQLWWKDTLNRFTLAKASDVVNFQDTATGKALIGVQNYLGERFDGTTITKKIDYAELSPMPDAVKRNRGSGIQVAILDHAIHPALQFANPVIRPFPGTTPIHPHAAVITGLIAGNTNLLAGIAPDVQLIELPIYDGNGVRQDAMIKNAVGWLSSQPGPVIVNCSQDLASSCPPSLLNLKNVFIIASAGIDEDLISTRQCAPASNSNTIAVGATGSDFWNRNPNPAFKVRLDYFLSDFKYVSLDFPSAAGTAYRTGSGDSFATAIVSGMAALALKAMPGINSIAALKAQIATFAQPLTNKASFPFLNPIKNF